MWVRGGGEIVGPGTGKGKKNGSELQGSLGGGSPNGALSCGV